MVDLPGLPDVLRRNIATDTTSQSRALNPSTPFIGIDIRAHTAEIWSKEPYKFSFTTLSTAADAIRLILLHADATKNRVVPVQNFSLSQKGILELLEKIQGLKYRVTQLEGSEEFIRTMKKRWSESGGTDVEARLGLAKAGFLLPGYGSNFEENERWGLGNEMIGFENGGLTVEGVLRDAVEKYRD